MQGRRAGANRKRALGGVLALLVLLGLALLLLSAPLAKQVNATATEKAPLQLAKPDLACAECHRAIYESYQGTFKAKGSGIALDALDPGAFHHKPSGIDYRVFLRDGAAWMSFRRAGQDHQGSLEGEHKLEYFVGSGHRGRTYLFQQGGQWFELPINFYNRRETWDMAPAFDGATTMPAVLPTDPNCLHCHATGVQPSLPTARNRFASVPFTQGGVGCAACHGDAARHLAANGHGPILNPGKLTPARRESACLQCHLEGDAVVYRPGRSLADFRVGEDLADTAVYFVRASQQAGGRRASSQYEALLRSACRRAAGDKLTCTTCHDPHATPVASERVQYFRSRCLSCHSDAKIATTHFPSQPDCAGCHMPTRSTSDISHEQLTDHDIEAHPSSQVSVLHASGEDLVPVGGVAAGDREYGLAYAQVAARGDGKAAEKALALLNWASVNGSTDAEVEARLGYLRQLNGTEEAARSAYARALEARPDDPTSLANLAVLDASSGRLPEAVRLLNRLVEDDPSQTAAGLNLAFIVCRLGHPAVASRLLDRLAKFNSDDPQLRAMREHGLYGGERCNLTTDERKR